MSVLATPLGSGAVDDVPSRAWTVHDVIDLGAVETMFQPVVHLATGSVVGFEALSRGPAGSWLESPATLFDAAAGVGRVGELDWLCRATAIDTVVQAALPESLCWLLNVEPAGVANECPAHLVESLQRGRAELRIVLELVERDLQANLLQLIQTTDRVRRDSWGVALDDVGAQPSSLAVLPLVRPDIVKLDMSLVQHLPRAAAAAATAAVRAYAEESGAVILAEGIETREHVALARVLGATYAQGHYYGRPGPLPAQIPAPADPIPLRQYIRPLDGRTPFDTLVSDVEPQRGSQKHLRHIATHLEREAARHGGDTAILLTCLPAGEFTDVRQRRLGNLADSNALTAVLAPDAVRRDEPTYRVQALPPDSPLGGDWMVIVINAHFAGAFLAREVDPSGTGSSSNTGSNAESQREFDFIYTHQRDAVIQAARCFLHHLGPRTAALPPRALDVAPPDSVTPATRERPLTRSLEGVEGATTEHGAFAAAARVVLDFLSSRMPMSLWSITRVENDRQTVLFLGDNQLELVVGHNVPWQDSFCINMTSGAAPAIAENVDDHPLYAAVRDRLGMDIGGYAGSAITDGDGSLFGVICGFNTTPLPGLAEFEDTLATLSALLTLTLRTDRALQAARHATRTALSHATIDTLTGIPNRRAWDAAIGDLATDYATYADPAVIVIVDLDNLKTVNDGPGGHAAGDTHLRLAAEVMRNTIREDDFLARLGGDEFGIIFRDTPANNAPALMQRVTRALERACIDASAGWSALAPDVGVTTAIEFADRAMYETKRRRAASSRS